MIAFTCFQSNDWTSMIEVQSDRISLDANARCLPGIDHLPDFIEESSHRFQWELIREAVLDQVYYAFTSNSKMQRRPVMANFPITLHVRGERILTEFQMRSNSELLSPNSHIGVWTCGITEQLHSLTFLELYTKVWVVLPKKSQFSMCEIDADLCEFWLIQTDIGKIGDSTFESSHWIRLYDVCTERSLW